MGAFRRGLARVVQLLLPGLVRRLAPVPVPKVNRRHTRRPRRLGTGLGSLAAIFYLALPADAREENGRVDALAGAAMSVHPVAVRSAARALAKTPLRSAMSAPAEDTKLLRGKSGRDSGS